MLADFLYEEAELAAAGGLCDLEPECSARKTSNRNKQDATARHSRVYTITRDTMRYSDAPNANSNEASGKCLYCDRGNHTVESCRAFLKETPSRRWYFARKWRVCYKCLRVGHSCVDCDRENCATCRRPHHAILHDSRRPAIRHNSDGNASTGQPAELGRVLSTGNKSS